MSERLGQLVKLYEADGNDPFLSYGIALEYAKDSQFDDAMVWLDKTIEVDPDYCYAYYQKARILGDLGDTASARRVLDRGMEAAQRAGDEHARSEMTDLLGLLESP